MSHPTIDPRPCGRLIVLGLVLSALAAVGGARATGSAEAVGEVDTDALANVLSAAYLAENLSLVCAEQDRWFLEDTKGSAGNGRDFAGHVRSEVLARLTERDAGSVVLAAANAARAVSLGMVHVMGDGSSAEQSDRLSGWCETTAKPLVKGILAQHEIRHDLYEQIISQAKR